MTHHVYAGHLEDGVFTLTTDGEPEPIDPWTSGFSWGQVTGTSATRTALRILSREIPVPAIYDFVGRFEGVLRDLPGNWRITSEDIRRFMNTGEL